MNALLAALLLAVASAGVQSEPNWSNLSTDVELLAEMINDRNTRLTVSMLVHMLSGFQPVAQGGSDALPPIVKEETEMAVYRRDIDVAEASRKEEETYAAEVVVEEVVEVVFENPTLEKLVREEKNRDAEDMERIVERVEKDNKMHREQSTYAESLKKLMEDFKLSGWPKFVAVVKDLDFVKLLDTYSDVDILHSNLVRALREAMISQAGLDPLYWVVFDVSLILVAFAICMSLSLLLVLLLALASFMVWDGIFWLIAVVAVLKLLARCFMRSSTCTHDADRPRSSWKSEGIVIFILVLMVALVGVGLYATKIIDGNIVWGCVILTVVLIQIPIFPTVVKKSSSEGLWYGAFIVVLLTFGVVVMAQTDLISMYSRIRLRMKYPSADLDKYAEGYRAVDEARIAADLSQAAGTVDKFITAGIPMTWMDALSNPSTARETVSHARVYGSTNGFIWLTTEDHTTNVLMTFVCALAIMSLFMVSSMGAKMAVEGEKREQNQATRGKDALNKVDYTFTAFARMNSALTVSVIPLVMVVEYAGYQALFSKLHNMYGFIAVVMVCIMLASYWIEHATAEAWMAMGAASHRSAKNTTAGVAHVSASSLKPLEDSVSGYFKLVIGVTSWAMAYLLWQNGGWYMVYWTVALGAGAVLMVDVSQVRLHKQFWVLLPLVVLMQFYGTAVMLIVWKKRGNITTYFTHRLHNVGAALQMVD